MNRSVTQPFLSLLLLCWFVSVPQLLRSQAWVDSVCQLSPYKPGEHLLWLSKLPTDPDTDYVPDGSPAVMTFFSDSTATITARVINRSDSSRQWDLQMRLILRRDYNAWTALGRDTKNGGGNAQAADWVFYEMDSTESWLYGVPGTFYDGDTLQLSHNPPNREFGFQIGWGANDKNGQYGISGWFLFEGDYQGHGDINALMSCATPQPCAVTIDTAFAQCKTDSSFELVVTFSGQGQAFDLYDDQGSTPLTVSQPGTYVFGEYLNSLEVMVLVKELSQDTCVDIWGPVTADCTPVPVCDLVLDSVSTECATDSSFRVVVSFSGSGSQFQIFDNLGTQPLLGLTAGTYVFGEYLNGTPVSLTLLDFAIFNCFLSTPVVTDSCTAPAAGVSVWGNFQATPAGGSVVLTWASLGEQGATRFIVEKSSDSLQFEVLADRSALSTDGRTQRYEVLDGTLPESGRMYYRLCQQDVAGRRRFSGLQVVDMGQPSAGSIGLMYPVPVAATADLPVVAAQAGMTLRVEILDPMGRVWRQEQHKLSAGSQVVKLDWGGLPPGLYYLMSSLDGGERQVQQVLVWH